MPFYPRFYQDPAARRYRDVDWASLLGSDTISDADWIVPAGITLLGSPAPSVNGTIARAWFEGGTLNTSYLITCRITTSGGQQLDYSFEIYIRRVFENISKDPDDDIDHAVDWKIWLNGLTINADNTSWSASGGVSVAGSSVSGTRAISRISGDEAGELLNLMTASDGQKDVAAFKVFINQR